MIQYIKVTISLLLSLLAICLYQKLKGEERKYCMVGMMLSTAGDIFMTDVLKLGAIGTYPGAAFFILAHIVYAFCFFRAGKKYGITLKNNVRGKMILPSSGKEFFTSFGKQNFTCRGNEFFTPVGKQIFT